MKNNFKLAYSPMRDCSAGFTLIEILVVLAILGILATSLAIVFKTSTEAYKKSDDLVEVYQEARAILERMSKELQSAYLSAANAGITFEAYDESNNKTYDSASVKDEVYFVAPLSNSGDMDLVEVGYWLDSQGDLNRHLQIADKSNTPPLDFNFATGNSPPFAGNVTDLQLQYSPDGVTWQNTWDSAVSGGLPKAVKITITITKGKLSKTFSTQVAVLPR